MKLTPQQKAQLTPLSRWLLEYIRDHDFNLTDLAHLRKKAAKLGYTLTATEA